MGNNGTGEIVLKIHKCTDEDYDAFYKPAADYEEKFASLKQKKTLYCIDKGQKMELFGNN
jgi:hypothetical protein